MDEKNEDRPTGDAPGAISTTTPTGGLEVERKRDYDPVKEDAPPPREHSFSFSHRLNADVESRRQC